MQLLSSALYPHNYEVFHEKSICDRRRPAGLTAAYELLKQSKEYEVTVLEESDAMGGISKTVNYKGNRMDMGGHRFFSKVPEVNVWWDQMLPRQGAPPMTISFFTVR